MGLAERRGAEQFKSNDYPGWKSRIDEAAGFEVPVEVAWDELAVAGYAGSYAEFFPKVYFQPHANIDYGEERAKGLQRALEDGL